MTPCKSTKTIRANIYFGILNYILYNKFVGVNKKNSYHFLGLFPQDSQFPHPHPGLE